MRAFVVREPGSYGLEERERPVPGSGELLVRVGAATICHSDLDILDGSRQHFVRFPNVPGHEFAGTVAEVGSEVRGFEVGDRVVCEPIVWCGRCRRCRFGFTNQCENYDEIGTMRPGGFAEFAAVPAHLAHPVEGLSMTEAAVCEPAGNGLHAAEKAAILPGDTVVIIGPGSIGLFALQFARRAGPSRLVMIGTRDDRLNLARELGATHTINVGNEDPAAIIGELTGGAGADAVIQCATHVSAFQVALSICGVRSRLVVEGLSGSGTTIPLDFDQFVIKPFSILGAAGVSTGQFTRTLAHIENGEIDVDPLVTHVVTLSAIDHGFEMVRNKRPGLIKVAVIPEEEDT